MPYNNPFELIKPVLSLAGDLFVILVIALIAVKAVETIIYWRDYR